MTQYESIVLKANESTKAGVVFSDECLQEIAKKTKGMRYENGCLIASVSFEEKPDAC